MTIFYIQSMSWKQQFETQQRCNTFVKLLSGSWVVNVLSDFIRLVFFLIVYFLCAKSCFIFVLVYTNWAFFACFWVSLGLHTLCVFVCTCNEKWLSCVCVYVGMVIYGNVPDWRVAWRHCSAWMWQHLVVLLELRSLALSFLLFALSTPHQHQRASESLPHCCVSTRGRIKLTDQSQAFLLLCRTYRSAGINLPRQPWGMQLVFA